MSLVFFTVLFFAIICHASLPSLPNQFTAIIEGNIVDRNRTFLMKEYYDYNLSQAKREMYYGNLIITQYENFENNADERWSYSQHINDLSNIIHCTLNSYNNSVQNQPNNFIDVNSNGHLKTSSDWLLFGDEFNESYIGIDRIRGILSEGWNRIVTDNITFINRNEIIFYNYSLEYFFSLENWQWFFSNETRIPVRIKLIGYHKVHNLSNNEYLNQYNFEHYYDYISFIEGYKSFDIVSELDIFDKYENEWIDQCNVSAYCNYNNYQNEKQICSDARGPNLPLINNQYSARYEVTDRNGNNSYYGLEHYDYDNDREYIAYHINNGYYNHSVHILNLFDSRQQWIWYGERYSSNYYNCYVSELPGNNFTGFYDYFFEEHGHIAKPNIYWQFNDNQQIHNNETWMGYTEVRGIKAEKWKTNYDVFYDHLATVALGLPIETNQGIKLIATAYHYFSSNNWLFKHDSNESIVPLRFEINGKYIIYNYSDITQNYSIYVKEIPLNENYDIFEWITEKPSHNEFNNFFQLPRNWRRKCTNIIKNFETDYCTHYPDESICDFGNEYLPELDNRFYTVWEVTDVLNETTWIAHEWFDETINKFRYNYYYDRYLHIIYNDLDTDKQWTWVYELNNTQNLVNCSLKPYTGSDNSKQFSEHQHLKSTDSIFNFGQEYNETYLGNYFRIRDIKSKAWHRYINQTVDNKTYYYDAIWYMADDSWDFWQMNELDHNAIPLRAEFVGYDSDGKNYDYNIEFVSFLTGSEAFDEKELEFVYGDWYTNCDLTEYCNQYSSSSICLDERGPKMPELPNDFRAMAEISIRGQSNQDVNVTYLMESYYDFDGNRAHIIFHDGNDFINDAYHQLEILNSRQRWTWKGNANEYYSTKDCKLKLTEANYNGIDLFIQESNGHLSSPAKWFRWNNSDVSTPDIWHGYQYTRNIRTEKWVNQWHDYTEFNEEEFKVAVTFNATANYYWSTDDWAMKASNWSNVPIRLELFGTYILKNYSEITKQYDIYWRSDTVDMVIDFVEFYAGKLENNLFEIPRFWRFECNVLEHYCNDSNYNNYSFETCDNGPKNLPQFPDSYSTIIQAIFEESRYTVTLEEYYNYNTNQFKLVIYPYNNEVSVLPNFEFSPKPFWTNTWLENNSIIWYWTDDHISNDYSNDCSLERVEQFDNKSVLDDNDYGWFNRRNEHVTPTKKTLVWYQNKSIEHYVGKHYVNGIYCDQWNHLLNDSTDNYNGNNDQRLDSLIIIEYFWMDPVFNLRYPNFDIPVQIRVIGYDIVYSKTSNLPINTIKSFHNYYNFINFIPQQPNNDKFYPPSLQKCNFIKFCSDISGLPVSEYNLYKNNLIEKCHEMDPNGFVVTDNYINCKDLSNDKGNNCGDSKSTNSLHPGYVVLMIVLLFIGVFIGLLAYHCKVRKSRASFQRFNDEEVVPTSNANTKHEQPQNDDGNEMTSL